MGQAAVKRQPIKMELVEAGTEQEVKKPSIIDAYRDFWVRTGFLMPSTKMNGDIVFRPTLALILLVLMLVIVGIGIYITGRLTGYEAGRQQTEVEQIKEDVKDAKQDAKTAKEFNIAEREARKKEEGQKDE